VIVVYKSKETITKTKQNKKTISFFIPIPFSLFNTNSQLVKKTHLVKKMDPELSAALSEIREFDLEQAKAVHDELDTIDASLEFMLFNKYDIVHIKYNRTMDNLKWIQCALLGNLPEFGIPVLPVKTAEYYEDWDKHITFDKTLLKPTKKHIKMANKVGEAIDQQEKIAEEAYLTALAVARINGNNPALIAHNEKYEALFANLSRKLKRKVETSAEETSAEETSAEDEVEEPMKKMSLDI